MPEQILFETESRRSRTETAEYLRTVAAKLESGDAITFAAGEESVTVDVPAEVDFEVAVEREGPSGEPGELSIELELEWDEGTADGGGDLAIE